MPYPSVSFVIPTLNSGKVLGSCLTSIVNLDYPQNKIEIIIADGGSADDTLIIAKKYKAKIHHNRLMTGEAGKAVGVKYAKNQYIAFVDSDNELPGKDWLKKMLVPFADKSVVGSEPWEYEYRKSDGFITRYSAMLGMNDPLCLFLGNYDRISLLTGKWTGIALNTRDCGSWLELSLNGGKIPTLGANGTVLKSTLLRKHKNKRYLFDIDILALEAQRHKVIFAKVKTGIIHSYCESDIRKFYRKQSRRVQDYLFYQKMGVRSYNWQQNYYGIFYFVISCVTVVPLLFQSVIGLLKKPDPAWLFHPLACWITLYIYSKNFILDKIGLGAGSTKRHNWSQ